jgi:pyruvate/2-oxoglutarate dehydrogenase complex dihydrolipoamide dehydrogenase (E3) component
MSTISASSAMSTDVDVVVVGMGPGGESAAGRLASAGMTVVGIDERLVGGECPYYGCIPSKMIIRASTVLAEARRVGTLAGTSSVQPDFSIVARRIRDEATDDWNDAVAVKRFTDTGGTFRRGHGRLTGPHTVSVGGEEFVARRAIILNTGTAPAVPSIDGLAGTPYWTNRDILRATAAPRSLVVIGGGAIGAELAQAFSRFGTAVTVLEAGPRILGPEEPEASAVVAGVFADEGIDVRTGVGVDAVRHDGSRFEISVGGETLAAERLLVATGRRLNLHDIGLEQLGIDPGVRHLDPDDTMRIADGVYAIGDIVGQGAFTHMSMYQADVAVRNILGDKDYRAEYHAVPRVTFTDPEVGSVGMTAEQARRAGLDVRTGSAPVPESTRGWIHRAGNHGFVMLVADAAAGTLVGATSVGPTGGEVLSALTLAVSERIPVARLRRMIDAYPTFHRTISAALDALR